MKKLDKIPLLHKEDTLMATFLKMLNIIGHQGIQSKTSIIYHCIPPRITKKKVIQSDHNVKKLLVV